MNGLLTATTSPIFPIPPPGATPKTSRLSPPTTRPEFSSFKFKNIGQPPTLLSRFSGASAASDYRSPSPERCDMDADSPQDPMMVIDDRRTFHSAPRKSLLDMLGDQGYSPKITITQTQDMGGLEPTTASPTSASSSKPVLARPESRLTSVSRQLSIAVDPPHADPSSPRASTPPEIHTYGTLDSDMADLYVDPASPSPPRSPLSLFADLSEVVRESGDLDRITSLHNLLTAEREELLARHEETARALSRAKTQLGRVLSLTDEAIQMTTVFVDKERTRLETKRTKAEAKIERRKNLEAEQLRKARGLERIRHEEERKAQVEMEQQAERQRLEDQRKKEEALATERQRQEEIQARERAQVEERRRLEEERARIEEAERRRLAEEDRRRQDEEERKLQAEEERRQEEEEARHRKTLAEEREALARKQQEERRLQLLERRKMAEDEMRQKEAEAAAAKAKAEKQAAEKEQQRIFQERRATVLKDKYKNYNRPESGAPLTGSSSNLEGTSNPNPPWIIVNDMSANPQALTEQYPGVAKGHRARDTPTFVPASTEAGKLPPDLSQRIELPKNPANQGVKNEATSPVITPVDDGQPEEVTPPSQLPPLPISSVSTSTLAPAPAHLPPRPVFFPSSAPAPSQSRARTPPRYPPRRSRSRSRSPPRSPRRGSPIPRIPSRASRSPDPVRGRYRSPPAPQRNDHYSPPHTSYRDGGSRYERGSRSPSPLPHVNPRKRPLRDHWSSASTSSKLDYAHPAKRRAASPLRSRSPPSPRSKPLTHPPPVLPTRRPPQNNKRGRGGGSSSHLPLEKRLAPLTLGERLGWENNP